MRNRIARLEPTVSGFLTMLTGLLTQYDMRQMRKRFYNPNALSHYMGAVQRIEEKFSRSELKSSDTDTLLRLSDEIDLMFSIPGMKNRVIKAINQYIENGKLPKYPTTSAARKRKANQRVARDLSVRESAKKVLEAMKDMETALNQMPSFTMGEDRFYNAINERWHNLHDEVKSEIKYIKGAY